MADRQKKREGQKYKKLNISRMKRALQMKFGHLCKALKYHWLLPSIWNQEGSTEENLNCSKNI